MYPSPLPPGIAGFVFDLEGESRLEIRSEITDHYLEDNTAVHDQCARVPERITLRGSTAEIVYTSTAAVPTTPQPANPLPINSPLVPSLTPGAQQAQAQSQSAVNSQAPVVANNLWQYYKGLTEIPESRQAQAVGFLYQLWQGLQMFTVETPWGIMDSMMIELLEPVQNETTQGITDFTVTFKKLRLAGDPVVSQGVYLGRLDNQNSENTPSVNGGVGQTPALTQQTDQWFQNWVAGLNASGAR